VTGSIVEAPDIEPDRCTGGSKLGRSEPFVGVCEKGAREPAVLRDIVILEKELSTGPKQSSDLAQRRGPIGDMVNNGEVHDDIKEAVLERQRAHVTQLEVCPIALGDQALLRATNHLRVNIDSGDLSLWEVNKQQLDADTLPAPDFKNSLRVGRGRGRLR
jgi:hypothetical protein